VPLLGKRFAAEDHQPRGAGCLQYDLRAGLEYNQPVFGEVARLAFNLDLAADDVGTALDVLRADLEAGAIDQGDVGVKEIGKGAGWVNAGRAASPLTAAASRRRPLSGAGFPQ
jgi:hypothetical protein